MDKLLRYDHYKVLGLPRDASTGDIRRAYRALVKQWHPDRNGSPRASEVFRALHEAYTTLLDPTRRAAYDEELRFYREARNAQPMPGPSPRPPRARPSREATVGRFAYYGLHAAGLAFGIALVTGILVGVLGLGWPVFAVLFTAPGLVVIPDAYRGLRRKGEGPARGPS
jgi:hypothetical protein